MIVPVAVGVKIAEQVAVVAFRVVSVQGEPVNAPGTVPVLVKETVPVGVVAPVVDVSFTVAVHVDPWLTTTGPEQETVVAVG